jgi:nucleoside-diphosphate-sugar epimerase
MGDKRILMTGASGFVGHWMYAARPCPNIYALNRQQYEAGEWQAQEWDTIIHLANVNPFAVIQCAKRSNARILYASSGATVDSKPNDYSRAKLEAEDMLLDSGLDVRIARMYTFCGGWMPNRFAVINMIDDAIRLKVIKIRGRADVVRTYMYASDMADWMWAILERGKEGVTYNVGSEKPVSMWQLAQEVQKHFDNPMIIEHQEYFIEPRPYYVPDTFKTRQDCKVEVTVPFEEAIARTVAHYVEEAKYHAY